MKKKGITIIIGAGGIVGLEYIKKISPHFEKIIGIDNDLRCYFFDVGGSVAKNIHKPVNEIDNYERYSNWSINIRLQEIINEIYAKTK